MLFRSTVLMMIDHMKLQHELRQEIREVRKLKRELRKEKSDENAPAVKPADADGM